MGVHGPDVTNDSFGKRLIKAVVTFFWLLIFAAIIAAAVGCAEPNSPVPLEVPNASEWQVDNELAVIWTDTQNCLGIKRSTAKFYVTNDSLIVVDGIGYRGYWFRRSNRIFITARNQHHKPLLQHEIIHSITQDGNHPNKYFNAGCGNLNPVPGPLYHVTI